MRKILIINGHPNKNSFNYALAQAYYEGATQSGAQAEILHIGELQFNPNLEYGYQKRIELEPDLLLALEKIKNATHLVWIHPVWWGGFPAIMKGFIDRLFLPGIAFEYKKNSILINKLLKEKTARIITTLDQPSWFYKLIYHAPSVNQLKKCILHFCGIKPIKITYLSFVKKSTEKQRKKWLEIITQLGTKQQ